MANESTISGETRRQPATLNIGMLRGSHLIAFVRSLLSGTRFLHRAVRSLSKQVGRVLSDHQHFSSSILLKPKQALMLAGIRCAGAGGGGPGR